MCFEFITLQVVLASNLKICTIQEKVRVNKRLSLVCQLLLP